MFMDKVRMAFLRLLRAGLWSEPLDVSGCFPLSDTEWRKVYALAIAQTVEGVLYDAVEKMESALLPPRALSIQWLVRVTKIEQRSRLMNQLLERQVARFDGLDNLVFLLKGQGLAAYYINPLRRVCGDIDWYFSSFDDFRAINKRLQSEAGGLELVAGKSAFYMEETFEVDHHARLIDLHSPFIQGFLKKLEAEEFKNRRLLQLDAVACWTLSPMLNILQVVTHILKHLLSFGIGIRQLCDVARLYYVLADQLDGQRLQFVYRKLGIAPWVDLLHDLLVRHVGLPVDKLPYKLAPVKDSDWMLMDILDAGNFGFHDQRYNRENDDKTSVRKNSFKRVSMSLWRYAPYAPMEALSFPFVQLYSGVFK